MNVKPTTERLAEALIEASAPQEMIEKARAGYYDDFKSDLAFPLRQLVADARLHNLLGIAEQAMHGDFDATKEESDDWAKSLEGQETIAAFLPSLQKRPASHRQQHKQRNKRH